MRRAWDWESGVLEAVYHGSNPPPKIALPVTVK